MLSIRPKFFLMLLAASVLSGCSFYTYEVKPESTKSAQPAPKPASTAGFETGRFAFQKLYVSALIWGRDVQPLMLESVPRRDDTDGRAAEWTAKFVSPGKQSIRSFTWSIEEGVSPGRIDVYSPGNASTQAFNTNFLKIDSDKAFEIAQKNGGKAVLKKNPDLPIKFALMWDRQHNRLLWRVIYGPENQSKLRLLVNALTGEFVGVEK
jgi:hypothetical protein